MALILAFIPVLFPVVLIMGVLVCLTVVSFFREGASVDADTGIRLFRFPGFGKGTNPLTRSILAMVVSLGLYLVLWLHSQLFYVGPLKKDQEPLRRDAFERMRESDRQEPRMRSKL